MRTVVTGGAGFIGSTLVDRLLAGGHSVDVVDDFSTGSAANLADAHARHSEGLVVHEVDVRAPALLEAVLAAEPEVVFHLAAQADVRVSVADPVLDADVNVLGTIRVLEAARQAGARKVVFASSGGTIYGDPDVADLPVRESHPQRPLSPYGVAKKAGGDYLHAYRALHDLDGTSLALANVYGPRQDPHGEAGVVAIFAGLLLAGERCTVFGTGEQTRDFVFVDDVAGAFVAAADQGSDLVVNIGTGVETSVNRLHSVMADAAGVADEPLRAPARPGELDRSALDPSLADEALAWQPSTTLEVGISRVLDWFRLRSRS